MAFASNQSVYNLLPHKAYDVDDMEMTGIQKCIAKDHEPDNLISWAQYPEACYGLFPQ
jgi:hypothetical protein